VETVGDLLHIRSEETLLMPSTGSPDLAFKRGGAEVKSIPRQPPAGHSFVADRSSSFTPTTPLSALILLSSSCF
jgi:hypothetical protein